MGRQAEGLTQSEMAQEHHLIRWSRLREIGWSRFHEIAWSLTFEIGLSRPSEILHARNHYSPL